jgi:hypothetical protein
MFLITGIGIYFAYTEGVKNYQELVPILCGTATAWVFLKIMLCFIQFTNFIMGWKSFLTG